MSNLFLNMSNIHSYITQSSTSEIKFYVKSSRIEIQSNSFFWLGVLSCGIGYQAIQRIFQRELSRVLCNNTIAI